MSLPLEARPLDELLSMAKISLWYMGYKRVGQDALGQPLWDHNIENWEASVVTPKRMSVEGPTPRDAVIALLKKMNVI
jgi:hypothetical protein